MKTYNLDTLLNFFKEQKQMDYYVIELINSIMEDREYSEEDKRDYLAFTLRSHGLFETTYIKGAFVPTVKRDKLPDAQIEALTREVYQQSYIVRLFTINLLNDSIQVEFPLN